MKELLPTSFLNSAAMALDLDRCAAAAEKYGLTITPRAAERISRTRTDALKAAGRVEFAPGVPEKLIFAFCPSPYLNQAELEDTLCSLCELFYYFKNECPGITDDELIHGMCMIFDGPANGSAEYLAGISPEALRRVCISESIDGLITGTNISGDAGNE